MAIKASDNFKVYRNPNGPNISTVQRPIIEKDGLYFKDIDGSGTVSSVNDWRLSPEERAAAYVKQMTTDEKYFSFTVRTAFDSKRRFDQCGIVMYLDSDNWLKASIEYENEEIQHLGSVVTNNGYSDWATITIYADVKAMWYRFSRREDDYRIECSQDGANFHQMRICHMCNGGGEISFGIYACSPEDSSFTARFTDLELTECKWLAHDGQKPDME